MSAPITNSPVARRDLKSPYFVLRTPDGTGTYFTAENLPIIMSPKEPISRFLAPARSAESGTFRSIIYTLDAVPLETASQMEFLPQSEIDAFAAAARAFYEVAHAATPRVVPHEKRLRAHFRLPDPDLEPDAYWVYGPAHDRRLLILWGCEFRAGTSLLLVPDEELKIPSGRTVLDKLQARVMTWAQRQREALKIALLPNEPISRFLARPAVDTAGKPVGLQIGTKTVNSKSFKPLKRVLKPEVTAFEKAARAYYDKASPDAAGVTPYEKELRRSFRLPDPDLNPGTYFIQGKSLVIAPTGKETHEGTLPLVEHAALPASAPVTPGDEAVIVASAPNGSTVVAKLRLRAISSGVIAATAAAVFILVLGAGFAAWKLTPNRTPPKIVDFSKESTVATPKNTEVIIRFSKPIDAASLHSDLKNPAFRFGDDKAKIEGTPKVDEKDRSLVVIDTSLQTPLVDGEKYTLAVRNIADVDGNKLLSGPPVEFTYLDVAPPVLTKVSAGANKNQLVLVFSRPVDPASVARGSNYSVTAADGSAIRVNSGQIDPDDKQSTHVILDAAKDFSDGLDYKIEAISGVIGTTKSKVPVEVPSDKQSFTYDDVLPPRIKGVSASAGKLQVIITYNKPVDPTSATDTTHYAVTGPKGSELSFVAGAAKLDPTGRVLTLLLKPQAFSSGRYQLSASGIKDTRNNVDSQPLQSPFEFFDAMDSSALTLTANKPDGTQMRIQFSRVISPDDASNRTKFSLTDGQGQPISGISISEAHRSTDNPTDVILALSSPPPPGTQLVVHASGITDIFGKKQDNPVVSKPVVVPGVSELTEQLVHWMGSPLIYKDGTVVVTVSEVISVTSAKDPTNYEFSPDSVQVRRVDNVKSTTKNGNSSTVIKLTLSAPILSPAGIKLSIHNLRLNDFDAGPQYLEPKELATAP